MSGGTKMGTLLCWERRSEEAGESARASRGGAAGSFRPLCALELEDELELEDVCEDRAWTCEEIWRRKLGVALNG